MSDVEKKYNSSKRWLFVGIALSIIDIIYYFTLGSTTKDIWSLIIGLIISISFIGQFLYYRYKFKHLNEK